MPGYRISKVIAREVLDSRGNPTVECVAVTGGHCSSAIVPSGASTGRHEALELRDGGKRFGGKGVSKAVDNINRLISKKIVGMDCTGQQAIDDALVRLDGTDNKARLGANAILAVSLAVARSGAAALKMPLHRHIGRMANNKKFLLPLPFSNVINGGKHAGGDLKFQEFMIVPVGSKSFQQALQMVAETYHALKGIIEKQYGKSAVNVGDEGGFAPNLQTADQALQLLESAISAAGYKGKVRIAMDAAASEFYEKGKYNIGGGRLLSSGELVDYYIGSIIRAYKILSLEDAFDQDDFESFAELTRKSKIQIVGDDLLVTNTARIRTAIEKKACNCLLLKVNQIGTLTESLAAAASATAAKWNVMVSHRSGETEDSFISDLSVGLGCGQIKSGAPARSERVAKYNQLLRLEQDFGLKIARFGAN